MKEHIEKLIPNTLDFETKTYFSQLEDFQDQNLYQI